MEEADSNIERELEECRRAYKKRTAALSYDRSVALRKVPVDKILESMEAGGRFDPRALEHLSSIIRSDEEHRRKGDRLILPEELTPGMELADDLILANGLVLYPRGTILDEETRTRIINFDGMFPKSGLVRVYGAGQ